MAGQVLISGPFDDLRSKQIRFLQEASRLGKVTVLLWTDEVVGRLEKKLPKFPLSERRYLLEAIRYVDSVLPVAELPSPDVLPDKLGIAAPAMWAVEQSQDNSARRAFCRGCRIQLCVLGHETRHSHPQDRLDSPPTVPGRKKVIVTGCYDWLHSGHVRFFEEVSRYGDLYVVLGHDANIRLLKGKGHPLFPQEERRYVVGSVRFVKQALIATGHGWLDAEPEIQQLKPDIYAVNDDGDKGGKREYCAARGIEYLVLKRVPAPGLPRRSSTGLRGF